MNGRARNIPEFLEKMSKFYSAEGAAYAAAFVPRATDVVISPFAKAGTTWMQQIVHGLKTGGDMTFDEITAVVPWIELAHDLGLDLNGDQGGGFRAFKSHLSWADVPKGCRYICVIRDPRDSAVSFYKFMEGWLIEPGAISMEDFVCNFFSRRPGGKDYWTHLLSWWGQRDANNVLLLAFEDIKADHPGAVRRVAEFLGLESSEAALELATEQSTFDFMKRHGRHFDDHLVARARNAALDLPPDAGSTKVKSGQVGGHDRALNAAALAALDQAWAASVEKDLGFASYAALRAAL